MSRSIRSVKTPGSIRRNFSAHSKRGADLRGACWSRSRYSVFFTVNAAGLLEVYDILNGVDSPVSTYHVCNDSLTVIAPHENGQLLAVGGRDGNIYLMECSEGYTINTRTDKANFVDVGVLKSIVEKGNNQIA